MQTRLQSLLETATNIAVGLIVSFVVNKTVLPLYGFVPSASQNIQMVLIFTFVSIARSYLLRRFFNRIHRDKHHA